MTLKRGAVVLVRFPFSSGTDAKVRPALVVQADWNNRRITNTILAMITTGQTKRNAGRTKRIRRTSRSRPGHHERRPLVALTVALSPYAA